MVPNQVAADTAPGQTEHLEREKIQEQVLNRMRKLESLTAAGQDPFWQTKAEQTHHSDEIIKHFTELEGQVVQVAGRLMSKRGMGKVNFADLQDRRGRIQIFSKFDELGEEAYRAWQNYDIGDIVSVEGEVFRTQKGEISVRNQKAALLSKSLRPLPEKFHGLQDTDTRYRKRYLDLIVNPDVRETFEKRSKIIASMRHELEALDFIEVETPMLNLIAGGATARPFTTHHNTLDLDLFLRISPELYLKRLIVGGFERVFEIGRNFRNEGMSIKHNPEFTMIEMYLAYADYQTMMDLAEKLISQACLAVNGTLEISYQGQTINLQPPFARLSMIDAVRQYAGVDFEQIQTDEDAREAARAKGLADIEVSATRGELISSLFDEFCEDSLIQPTIIYDYPIEISPLAKKKQSDPRLTERFEIFIYGSEFGNAYSELNDPRDQKERFYDQLKRRAEGDVEATLPDEDFVEALEYALPPTGGLGIGIDRLVMLLTDNASIRDVLLFPTMRPLSEQMPDHAQFEEKNVNDCDQLTTRLEEIDFSKVKVEPLFEEMIDFETFSKADFRAVKVLNCEAVPKSKKLLKFTLDDGSDKERVILSGIKEYYNAEDLIGKTLLAICNLPPRKMLGIDSEGMIISAIHMEEAEEKLNLIVLKPGIPAGAKMY